MQVPGKSIWGRGSSPQVKGPMICLRDSVKQVYVAGVIEEQRSDRDEVTGVPGLGEVR